MVFGEYIKDKRQKKGFTLRMFADMVNIAPSYMSDIEKSKRNAPTQDILEKMAELLELTSDEKDKMFDLAADSKNKIAVDITNYVSNNLQVRVALRKAKDLNLRDEDWIKIIEQMINKQEG